MTCLWSIVGSHSCFPASRHVLDRASPPIGSWLQQLSFIIFIGSFCSNPGSYANSFRPHPTTDSLLIVAHRFVLNERCSLSCLPMNTKLILYLVAVYIIPLTRAQVSFTVEKIIVNWHIDLHELLEHIGCAAIFNFIYLVDRVELWSKCILRFRWMFLM